MNRKTRLICALVGNILTALLSTAGTVMHVRRVSWAVVAYYTTDSNILIALSSAVCAVYIALMLAGRREKMPRAAALFKYFTVCMIAVTFLVVIFVLSPMYDSYAAGLLRMLFYRHLLFHHFLAPVCGIVTFLCFDEKLEKNRILPLAALTPTFVYAVATASLNIARLLYGPYPFLLVYKQPVWASVLWFFAILSFAFLIALGVYAGQRALRKDRKKAIGT